MLALLGSAARCVMRRIVSLQGQLDYVELSITLAKRRVLPAHHSACRWQVRMNTDISQTEPAGVNLMDININF